MKNQAKSGGRYCEAKAGSSRANVRIDLSAAKKETSKLGHWAAARSALGERKSIASRVLLAPKTYKPKDRGTHASDRLSLNAISDEFLQKLAQAILKQAILKKAISDIIANESFIDDGPIVAASEKTRAALTASAFATGARGRALLRGREHLETLLADAGGTFSQEQVQTALSGISRQAIDKRVREGSLLSVPGPNGVRRFPVCQFLADGSLVKGMKELQAALPVRGPWSAFLFLMQPHADLGGRTPLDVLKDGDLALVIAAAERLGAQGS